MFVYGNLIFIRAPLLVLIFSIFCLPGILPRTSYIIVADSLLQRQLFLIQQVPFHCIKLFNTGLLKTSHCSLYSIKLLSCASYGPQANNGFFLLREWN